MQYLEILMGSSAEEKARNIRKHIHHGMVFSSDFAGLNSSFSTVMSDVTLEHLAKFEETKIHYFFGKCIFQT